MFNTKQDYEKYEMNSRFLKKFIINLPLNHRSMMENK